MNSGTELKPEPADVAGRLKIEIGRSGSALIVRARGEVDAYTLTAWRRMLREAAAPADVSGSVIVDISELDFIACSALAVLADQADACRAHGISLIVASRASTVRRIAAATDLGERLSIRPSTEAALLAAASGDSGGAAAATA